MTELSAGAWRLYCFLLRCRNTGSGRAFPSITITAEAVGTHPNNIYRLRKELTAIGWVAFEGDEVNFLLDAESRKNAKTSVDNTEDSGADADFSKNAKDFRKNAKKFSKNAKTYKEQQDEITRLKEQDEDRARLKAAVPPAVAFVRNLTHRYPDKTLWPRIVQTLGEDFDEKRLTECYENWVSHGWNKMNLVWLFEWYTQGIPERSNSGRHQGPIRETHNERAFRETYELAATAFQTPSSLDGPDTEDATEAGPAGDVGGV